MDNRNSNQVLPEHGLREKRLPRRAKEVQNKAPNPQQITAEQILREAHEMQFEKIATAPRQQITDPDELRMYKLRKRKNFENVLRRNRMSIGIWLKYAAWEESQKEFARARSIFERIIDIDYRSATIWLKYAEMEMRNRFISRARNVWDRAVQLLPRIDQLWFKYALMEEKLNNFGGARRVFERWIKWIPCKKAWMAYISLEMRSVGSKLDKINRCRLIYNKFINKYCSEESYISYAEWEYKKNGFKPEARIIYEKGIKDIDNKLLSYKFYKSFALFEVSCGEYDRARIIYKYALDHIAKYLAADLFNEYMLFEKKYGNKQSIDSVIINKKRFEYEQELVDNCNDYDLWFDYIKLEEQNGSIESIREIYERSIANIPPIITDKVYWRRYIYLWIKYAQFEEVIAKDMDRTRAVFRACLKIIPHSNFTFGKIWILFAEFEIRQNNINAARLIFGEAIGRCPKKNIFNAYIAVEYKLAEFDRVRMIYSKLLEWKPSSTNSWCDYAALENKFDEYERAKNIFELAIKQDILDEPDKLWTAYIDFELKRKNYDNVRDLFNKLLFKLDIKHIRVWIQYACFEGQINKPQNARNIFKKADIYFKNLCKEKTDKNQTDNNNTEAIESRVMLLSAWLQFESIWGTQKQLNEIELKQPKKVKKRKQIFTHDGSDAGWQEYYDYIFPDIEITKSNHLKLLERAKKWKLKQKKIQKKQQMNID